MTVDRGSRKIYPDPENVFDFFDHQTDEIINAALENVIQLVRSPAMPSPNAINLISSSFSTPTHRSLQPAVSIRCRSSSRHDRRQREISFHHTMPRCSLPTSQIELLPNYTRSSSYQQSARTNSNRTFDVQYSFSLNRPWKTKFDKQHHRLIAIQNFVKQFVEHSIRTALLQIDYQQLTNDNRTIYPEDASCVLFDCSPSYVPMERLQTISSFADRLIGSSIRQSIEEVRLHDQTPIERFGIHLADHIIADSLMTLADDHPYSESLLTDEEKQTRKVKRRSMRTRRLVNKENSESPSSRCSTITSTTTTSTTTTTVATTVPSLFQQIRHRSSSAFRLLNNHYQQRESVDFIVNNVAQQIYTDSFHELRCIFSKQEDR